MFQGGGEEINLPQPCGHKRFPLPLKWRQRMIILAVAAAETESYSRFSPPRSPLDSEEILDPYSTHIVPVSLYGKLQALLGLEEGPCS